MLKRVSIQNFKSLKEVTLDLQKVNLLIGPNNSGKTNFLKALESFSLGGLGSQNLEVLEAISFRHERVPIVYTFTFKHDPNGYVAKNNKKLSENLYNYTQKSEVIVSDGAIYVDTKEDEWFIDDSGNRLDETISSGYKREFFNFLNTKIFRPDPSKLIHTAKLSGVSIELASDGSNLIPFYFSIFNNFESNSVKIQSDLSRCVPEIARFRTPPVKGENMLGLKFFDKHEISYWANEVSEGVLYFLILLCIVHQPNPPKLLLLEEPERGIHPRRIWEVMKLIFELADERNIQIIITTHNEHIVNTFSTMPESIFVFDKDEEGATYVRNLQKDIIDPTDRKSEELGLDKIDLTSNLGENWLYGLIGGVPADEL